MLTLTPTTELDAVNIMLGTIGESPVNSLSTDLTMADVAIARQVLREVTIHVLEEGWHFNTEIDWPLTPTVDGYLLLPSNCLQADTTKASAGRDVTVRGDKLYDRDNRTLVFTTGLSVDMIVLLDFDQIPQAGRHYIALRAARVYQKRMIGSDTLDGFTKEDEARARASLRRMDANTADHNFLAGSWSVARILQR
jgi:hypothetical protein